MILYSLIVIMFLSMLAMTWFWYIKPKKDARQASHTLSSLKEDFDVTYHPLIESIEKHKYAHDACGVLLEHIEALEEEKKTLFMQAEDNIEEHRKITAGLAQKNHEIIHISHQMRTSLSGLLGFTHFLTGTKLNEEQKEFVDIISTSSNELLTLVNGILETAPVIEAKDEENLAKSINKIAHNTKIAKNEIPHILVVDDNAINRKLLSKVLENFNLTISFATNGQEAFDARKKNNFDMIFMDIQMPIMDGVESSMAIRAFEKEENLPAVPIVALTANTGKSHREKYINAGMDDYMVKPISIEDVKHRIEKLAV